MSHFLLKKCPLSPSFPCRPRPLMFSHTVQLGPNSAPLELSSGSLARLAEGAGVARLGSTAVLSTVCRGRHIQPAPSFLPLTVDYRQKAAAAGRIPANFLRRELGPSEREILTSRMIDRSVRPLAARGWGGEVGVTCNLLAVDHHHDPDVLAINATSLALQTSSLPWLGAVGAVRVGCVGGRPVVNPTRRDLTHSSVNIVLAGTESGRCTMMEGDARNVEYLTFLECVRTGLDHCAVIARDIESLAAQHGKTKTFVKVSDNTELLEQVRVLAKGGLRKLFSDFSLDKLSRDRKMFEIRDNIVNSLKSNDQLDQTKISEAFSEVCKSVVRDLVINENIRVDGRTLTQVRPISCEVNLFSPLHGSSLFQRGQTQVLCTVALDSLHSAQKLDPMSVITGGLKEKNFLLHYEFPSYATGDVRSGGAGANRRETGHGALAERAIRQVLPESSEWTTRLTSEVLESNGSSSMASVCGGTLALLDAGIPLTDRVSGVAMGLVTKGDQAKVLTDIMGMEDYMGDMDFKFAATRSGVCAVQADVKIQGIDYEVIRNSVEAGMEANNHILNIMDSCLSSPRASKECWPVSKPIQVPASKRGKFLGAGGINIKRISGETGVQINPGEEEGTWSLFAPSKEVMVEAETMIDKLLEEQEQIELEFGAIYRAKILELKDSGVQLQLLEGQPPVFLPNSQLAARKVSHPSALGLEVGQEIQVKYFGRDPVQGHIRVSRKVLITAKAAAVAGAISDNNRKRPSSRNYEDKSRDKRDPPEDWPPTSSCDSSTPGGGVDISDVKFSSEINSELSNEENSEKHETFVTKLSNPASVEVETIETENRDVPSVEEKYYHIDKLVNELIRLRIEITETLTKRAEIISELEKVKERLNFLKRPASTNLSVNEIYLKDNQDKYRSLLSRVKAIDEFISLLKRQYDDTSTLAIQEKISFQSSTKVPDSEPLEVPEIVDSRPLAFSTFEPESLKSRDTWDSDHPTVLPEKNPIEDKESIHDWQKSFSRPLPKAITKRCTKDKCGICKKKFSSIEMALEHYNSNYHFKKVELCLKQFYGPSKFLSVPRKLAVNSRTTKLDDKEAEMRQIAEIFSDQVAIKSVQEKCPWFDTNVVQFVLTSVEDFKTLLKWLDDLESEEKWNENEMNDVLYGLGSIHKNLFSNLEEIEKNHKYLSFHSSSVAFIASFVKKPDQFTLQAAVETLEKMTSIYESVVEELAKPVNISQRLDMKRRDMWRDYNQQRKKMKQIRDVLWEIEAREEKVAELDDWRQDPDHYTSPSLDTMCQRIDDQNRKIFRYEKVDVQRKWKTVDQDLKKLQLLRVKALLLWATEQPESRRPDWLCRDLHSYILQTCKEYCAMEKTAGKGVLWLDRDSNVDLKLEMAYTRLRSSINQVKYGSIENRRNSRELEIFQAWLGENKEKLAPSMADTAEELVKAGQGKCLEVESGLREYVSLLSAGDQDRARQRAESLELARTEKRNHMKELMSAVIHVWKGEGKDLASLSFTK